MFFAALVALSIGAPKDPVQFLRWSMDRHLALKSYQATVSWSMGGTLTAKRTVLYAAPNRFKVVSEAATGDMMSAVCDGKRMVERSQQTGNFFDAPSNIGRTTTLLMKHPMFCGSEIYRFFLGGKELDKLADLSKRPVRELPPMGRLRRIEFWGPEFYGTTVASIDPNTGLVRQLVYKSEPLLEQVKKQNPNSPIEADEMLTVEVFAPVVADKPLPAATFEIPDAPDRERLSPSEDSRPPVEIGAVAPDITFTGLDGPPKKLSSLRGKPVLIDFWATWCPPCRATLPHSQKMHDEFSAKGLQVLAVSDEDAGTVSAFWLRQKYTFPTFLDPKSAAAKTYKVNAIPTFVIVDAKGRLVDYIVGGGHDERIEAAVKKALGGVSI